MNTRLCSPAAKPRARASISGCDRPSRRRCLRVSTQRIDGSCELRSRRQLRQLIAARQRAGIALQRRGGGAQTRTGTCRCLRTQHRQVAGGIAQTVLLLERGVVLLVHHDQAEPGHRREHREPGADHDLRLPGLGCAPAAQSLGLGHAAVQARQRSSGKARAQPGLELRREIDLRHQQQGLSARVAARARSTAGTPRSCRCR